MSNNNTKDSHQEKLYNPVIWGFDFCFIRRSLLIEILTRKPRIPKNSLFFFFLLLSKNIPGYYDRTEPPIFKQLTEKVSLELEAKQIRKKPRICTYTINISIRDCPNYYMFLTTKELIKKYFPIFRHSNMEELNILKDKVTATEYKNPFLEDTIHYFLNSNSNVTSDELIDYACNNFVNYAARWIKNAAKWLIDNDFIERINDRPESLSIETIYQYQFKKISTTISIDNLPSHSISPYLIDYQEILHNFPDVISQEVLTTDLIRAHYFDNTTFDEFFNSFPRGFADKSLKNNELFLKKFHMDSRTIIGKNTVFNPFIEAPLALRDLLVLKPKIQEALASQNIKIDFEPLGRPDGIYNNYVPNSAPFFIYLKTDNLKTGKFVLADFSRYLFSHHVDVSPETNDNDSNFYWLQSYFPEIRKIHDDTRSYISQKENFFQAPNRLKDKDGFILIKNTCDIHDYKILMSLPTIFAMKAPGLEPMYQKWYENSEVITGTLDSFSSLSGLLIYFNYIYNTPKAKAKMLLVLYLLTCLDSSKPHYGGTDFHILKDAAIEKFHISSKNLFNSTLKELIDDLIISGDKQNGYQFVEVIDTDNEDEDE